MTFVLDQVRRIDAQLDRLQLASSTAPSSPEHVRAFDFSRSSTADSGHFTHLNQHLNSRTTALQAAIRALSPDAGDGKALLKTTQVAALLATLSERYDDDEGKSRVVEASVRVRDERGSAETDTSKDRYDEEDGEEEESAVYENDLEWLLVSKASTQVYGHLLTRILDETVALSGDVWYWDEVLSSRWQTAWYAVQTAPLRGWHWSNAVWADVRARGGNLGVLSLHGSFSAGATQEEGPLTQRWRQFYHLVRQVVVEQSVKDVRAQFLSPVTRIRGEVRQKRTVLRHARLRNANALGILLGEGLANETMHGDGLATPTQQDSQHQWKVSVARNVALMEAVLAKIHDDDTSVDKFDSAIAELTDDDPLYASDLDADLHSHIIAERLTRILLLGLPQYNTHSTTAILQHGKPPRLVRYWLPVTLTLLSSSTLLRILFNRQAQLSHWLEDLGTTALDFWRNWVVEPTHNLIKTIRHDADSDISIISKRSLAGDRESLERMVIDFARDNPSSTNPSSSPLNDSDLAALRTRIREGDLTPILRAYEKDLANPLLGALRGNLIRALLIQIQKTKVDIEIAMGGIDSLLKSQELLIGFISLTPGLLLTAALTHWVRTSFSSRQRTRRSSKNTDNAMLAQLRSLDRILARARPTEFAELPYRDMGLLLAEAHLLRRYAAERGSPMPPDVLREFRTDLDELCDVRVGVERQRKCLERLRWSYARWF